MARIVNPTQKRPFVNPTSGVAGSVVFYGPHVTNNRTDSSHRRPSRLNHRYSTPIGIPWNPPVWRDPPTWTDGNLYSADFLDQQLRKNFQHVEHAIVFSTADINTDDGTYVEIPELQFTMEANERRTIVWQGLVNTPGNFYPVISLPDTWVVRAMSYGHLAGGGATEPTVQYFDGPDTNDLVDEGYGWWYRTNNNFGGGTREQFVVDGIIIAGPSAVLNTVKFYVFFTSTPGNFIERGSTVMGVTL